MRFISFKTFCSVVFLALVISLLPKGVSAASLSINPASGTFEVGDRVTLRVVVTNVTSINAISSAIYFPTELFTIESVSKAGSILNFWVNEPNFSQGAGILQFEGVTLGGFNGGSGTVVSAVLRAVKPGSGTAFFKSGQILANDGQGTDITDNKNGATFSVVPAKERAKVIPEPVPPQIEEVPQPIPSLEAPEIMLSMKYGEKAISGNSSYPNSQVLVTFTSRDGAKVFITGTTDNLGQFTLIVPYSLKRGHYKVHAVVIKSDFTNSLDSNEITISVGSIISDISWEIRLAILLLIAALIYLVVRSYQYLKKNKKLKSFVRKEAQEAEEIVHKSFDLINEDIGNTKEVKKDLNEAERLITKEIKDIEKL